MNREIENHLYAILHPNSALIASQYWPEQLSTHYTSGPTRHYEGKVIFAEVDPEFRHPYFNIEEAMAELEPHEDGRPKATKFISSYRVLEHLDFAALKKLYLSTPEGYCIGLDEAPYVPDKKPESLRIYAEIDPMQMLVLSTYNFAEFGKFLTDPLNPVGAPKFLYADLNLDLEDFLLRLEENPFLPPPIPGLHPAILRDAINELRTVSYKENKGLSLNSYLDGIPYKLIGKGFMFASAEALKYFPMPSAQDIEKRSMKFARAL
ncbi:hypothetical protein B4O97_06395 [Marispirochaeta aestuarii]|uniref:Uncharacterized protein n=1 Tax=Marispirochaeta aestuarii TaxID=1963862 RepID=A0A1Y1RZN9_9SPIO|nr:hypothetical protein [Marispirochaeta aestuarii]ORC36217.1 hypothetical protein B4O97_06395 [Marispirochaeta aestuarii]